MNVIIARIFYVVFCIGCMVGLAMLGKYVAIKMPSNRQMGFIVGALFAAVIVAVGFWVETREGQRQ